MVRRAILLVGAALAAAPVGAAGQTVLGPAAPLPTVITPGLEGRRNEANARRGAAGYYGFDAVVNGVTLPMIFDTGATYIGLRAEDAARVGIDPNTLQYSRTVRTANGETQAAPVTVGSVTVGDITERNVPALVARPGTLHANLLGQTFLSRLSGYRLEGDLLILQGGRR